MAFKDSHSSRVVAVSLLKERRRTIEQGDI